MWEAKRGPNTAQCGNEAREGFQTICNPTPAVSVVLIEGLFYLYYFQPPVILTVYWGDKSNAVIFKIVLGTPPPPPMRAIQVNFVT